MAKSTIKIIIYSLLFIFPFSVCYAELPNEIENSPFDALKSILKLVNAKENEQNVEIKKFAIAIAQDDPELVNKIFDLAFTKESFLGKLMEDTNLKLKVFESDKEGESVSLGFNYSYAKNRKLRFNSRSVNYSGLDIALRAKGNVAFDKDANPNDFLDTKLSWSYFLSRGGVIGEIKDSPTLNKLDDLTLKLSEMKFKDFIKSPQWQEYKDIIGQHLTDQYYLDIGANGGLESDQSFDKKQYTFGVKAGFVPRGWGEDSILGKINVLDYIPALIRRYSGFDDLWQPRGSTFPSVLLGLDKVMPEEDDPRAQAGDGSDYTRFMVEASFKTLLTQWETDPVYVETNFRFFKEFDASQLVKNAELDEFTYFSLALRLPMNLFVSYTTGKLPLDTSDDQVYTIGLNYNF